MEFVAVLVVECGLDLPMGGLKGPQGAAARELIGPEEGQPQGFGGLRSSLDLPWMTA